MQKIYRTLVKLVVISIILGITVPLLSEYILWQYLINTFGIYDIHDFNFLAIAGIMSNNGRILDNDKHQYAYFTDNLRFQLTLQNLFYNYPVLVEPILTISSDSGVDTENVPIDTFDLKPKESHSIDAPFQPVDEGTNHVKLQIMVMNSTTGTELSNETKITNFKVQSLSNKLLDDSNSASIRYFIVSIVIASITTVALIATAVISKKHVDELRKQNSALAKERHADDLVREIYKPMLGIEVVQDPNTKELSLSYDKREINHGEEIVFGYLSIDNLKSRPRYNWAMKHLEAKEYERANKSWKETNTKLQSYNSNVKSFDVELEKTIIVEMRNLFPTFVESEEPSDAPNRYSMMEIKQRLYQAFGDSEHSFETFVIDRLASGTRCITPQGFNIIPILSCPETNQTELDIDRFNQVLRNIMTNQDLVDKYTLLSSTKKDINENLKVFKKELETMIEKLEGLQPLEGKCELGF